MVGTVGRGEAGGRAIVFASTGRRQGPSPCPCASDPTVPADPADPTNVASSLDALRVDPRKLPSAKAESSGAKERGHELR